jgi:ribonuclease HI
MSRAQSLKAAKNLAHDLNRLGIEAKPLDVENNEWLAKVDSSLGVFSVYTNAKGKVSVLTNFITDPASKDKALWALEQIHARATIPSVDAQTWVAYTDGSAQNGQCGWSMVFFDPQGSKSYEKCGNLGPQSNGQIAGEVEGAICVIKDAVSKKISKVILRHDYEGVGKWAQGIWKNKDSDATRLKDWVRYAKNQGVHLEFQWTRGHNGDAGNERADALASKATLLQPSERIKAPPCMGRGPVDVGELELT